MTHDHNHLGDNNSLVDDLFTPLSAELDGEDVNIGITNNDGSYIELLNLQSEELSLIEELMEGNEQDDDSSVGSLFNNRPRGFSFNYNNHSGGSYTGNDDNFSVNQDATNSQADDFGDEVIAKGTGLTGEYFDQANLTKSILTRTDTNIDFDWRRGSPDSAIKKNTFSVRWTGQIEATQNETYTFYTQADDGVRLWVNNELIIDDWQQHGVIEQSGTIDLEAGEFYDIKLEYFEKKGDASISLLWSSESQAKEVIPTSFLYPEDYVRTIPSLETEPEEPTTPQSKVTSSFSIMAEGQVRINGNSDFDGNPDDLSDDALIYAGAGFTLNGNITLPVQRDEAGNAITDANNKEILVDKAVAVSENYLQINANNSSNRYSGLVPPQIVDSQIVEVPEYDTLKDNNLTGAISDSDSVIDFDIRSNRMNNFNQWQQKFPASGTAENPTVVRISRDGLNIPSNVDFSNYVIIVEQGDINFNGSGHDLDNVVLVAENGNINLGNVRANNSRIFSARTVNMNGGARFSGESLIANGRGNITFDGATATTEDSDLITVVSAGDITFNGASDTRGQFLTANNFTFNGRSTLYGSIGAKQDITFNGKAEVIATAPPSVSIDDITIVEGDEGKKSALVKVNLSQSSIFTTKLDYVTENGTATAGIDYEAIAGQLVFEPLETTKTIEVPIIGDTIDEIDEAFTIKLNHVQSTVTIIDDDEPPAISVGDVSIVEGNEGTSNINFTISLNNASGKEITVDYATADITAISGEDYQGISGSLTFEPGETAKIIEVPIIGDVFDELDEAFDLKFSSPSNVTLTNSQSSITIIDDDEPPAIAIDSVVVEESDTDTTAVLTVTLDAPSNLPVSVEYSTADETAVASEDYQAVSGVITFEPGETTKTIPLTVIGDLNNETDETFKVNLTNPSNAIIAEEQGTVTIEDDDRRKGILLVESDNFSVRHTQVIDVPDAASVLSITYSELNFDTLDANSINDALEIALVDENGNSLVHTIDPQRDALFNLTEGESPDLAAGVTFEGSTIKVNLSDLTVGMAANLIVRLVNNDGDVNTSVRLTDISIEAGEDVKPVAIADSLSTVDDPTPIDFDAIEDVSASLNPVYGQTSFNQDTKTLYAELAVQTQILHQKKLMGVVRTEVLV